MDKITNCRNLVKTVMDKPKIMAFLLLYLEEGGKHEIISFYSKCITSKHVIIVNHTTDKHSFSILCLVMELEKS